MKKIKNITETTNDEKVSNVAGEIANMGNENRQERLEVNNRTRDETRVKAARQDNSIADETDDVEVVGLSKNMDANFSSALPDKNPRVGSDFQVTLPPVQKK